MTELQENIESQNKGKKSFVGKVVSAKLPKTVTVEVSTLRKDKRYKKYTQRRKKFMAHVEDLQCKEGDYVQIEECRPISKRKSFKVQNIVKRAELPQ